MVVRCEPVGVNRRTLPQLLPGLAHKADRFSLSKLNKRNINVEQLRRCGQAVDPLCWPVWRNPCEAVGRAQRARFIRTNTRSVDGKPYTQLENFYFIGGMPRRENTTVVDGRRKNHCAVLGQAAACATCWSQSHVDEVMTCSDVRSQGGVSPYFTRDVNPAAPCNVNASRMAAFRKKHCRFYRFTTGGLPVGVIGYSFLRLICWKLCHELRCRLSWVHWYKHYGAAKCGLLVHRHSNHHSPFSDAEERCDTSDVEQKVSILLNTWFFAKLG